MGSAEPLSRVRQRRAGLTNAALRVQTPASSNRELIRRSYTRCNCTRFYEQDRPRPNPKASRAFSDCAVSCDFYRKRCAHSSSTDAIRLIRGPRWKIWLTCELGTSSGGCVVFEHGVFNLVRVDCYVPNAYFINCCKRIARLFLST